VAGRLSAVIVARAVAMSSAIQAAFVREARWVISWPLWYRWASLLGLGGTGGHTG
jgi:hypothetical protein